MTYELACAHYELGRLAAPGPVRDGALDRARALFSRMGMQRCLQRCEEPDAPMLPLRHQT
jgi:hypothetical protein